MTGVALDERRLRSLIEVGRSVVAELDLEAVLERVLEVARDLTGARYAALGIVNDDRTGLERFITAGIDERVRAKIGDLPRGRGVLGLLIDDPRPLRLEDVSRHPRSYGFPPAHPPMRSFLGVPIVIRGRAFGNLYLTEKQGGAFDEADEQAAVILAGWAGIAIDNARLYSRVESRREELERAVRGLEATTEIALAVGGETDLDRVLEMIAKRGRALIEARSLLILLAEDEELTIVATAGEFEGDVLGARVPVRGTVGGRVLDSRKPERLVDLSSHLRFDSADLGVGNAASAMLVPLVFRGRGLGLLIAIDRLAQGPGFSEEDERLLLAFAASAATAVATAKSVAEDRLKGSIEASERERGRWARELHDETLQALGALRVLLSTAVRRGSPEAIETAARQAVSELGSEIDGLRGLIAELRPAALDEIGLAAAIQGLVERLGATEGLAVDAELSFADRDEHGRRFDRDVESTIYRLVQEALTNVAKHARAEHVRLRAVAQDGQIEIAVQDDGVGFDPEAPHEGFGILGMRERIAMAGGALEITSAPGTGVQIRASIPIAREALARASRGSA